jgi:hypothetical protein
MSQQKTIEDLRAMLFETIAAVKDGSMSVDKAKMISDLSQVMVNSAKVEVDFVKATGNKAGSNFLDKPSQLPRGITGITTHRIE